MRTILIAVSLTMSLLAQDRERDRGRPSAPAIEMGERGGRWYASTTVSSRGADAVQVFIDDLRLPEGAELLLYERDSIGGKARAHTTYTGIGPAGGAGFWSEAVPGATILLEVVYGDTASSGLPFVISDVRSVSKAELEPLALPASDELVMFEGDIILGPADKVRDRGAMGITPTNYRWTNGVMPYVIDPALPNQQRIHDAIAHWNSQLSGNLKLVPQTTEAAWVRFVPSGGCSSYIGRIGWTDQPIQIADWCGWGNVVHEIGHAAGLFHEQGREDRNNHIVLVWENLGDAGNNFSQYISLSDDIGAYDHGSIMHYPATAFSINGLPTILTIPPGIPIGQRSALSAGDLAGIRAMYPGSATPTPPLPPPPAPTQPTSVPVTIASNPPGVTLVVDGVAVVAPVQRSWDPGSSHSVSAPSSTSGATRYTFASWSDGGAPTHSFNTPSSASTIAATFGTQHLVTAVSSNSGLGSVSLSPASPDGFYAKGSTVTVNADAIGSGCLAGWSGITAPPASPLQVTVSQPYSIAADFQTGAVSVSPAGINVPWSGGTYTVHVTANTGCAWTASEDTNWITIRSGAGTGSGTVRFSVGWRVSRLGRSGTVRIGNAAVTVNQSGY